MSVRAVASSVAAGIEDACLPCTLPDKEPPVSYIHTITSVMADEARPDTPTLTLGILPRTDDLESDLLLWQMDQILRLLNDQIADFDPSKATDVLKHTEAHVVKLREDAATKLRKYSVLLELIQDQMHNLKEMLLTSPLS